MMDPYYRHEQFMSLCASIKAQLLEGNQRPLLEALVTNEDIFEVKGLVGLALDTDHCVDTVLERYITFSGQTMEEHARWVFTLSHLNAVLWRKQQYDWLRRLYQVVVEGVGRFGRTHSVDRIFEDFFKHAHWSCVAADFLLTRENFPWLEDKARQHTYFAVWLARIDASPFSSEEAYEAWKRENPEI